METDALRWFQLVADGMTVTEVSEVYGVSQPGVSRALIRLEKDAGTALLRRSGRVLRLTHAGSAFKGHVDRLINDLDNGLAAVDELVDPDSGVVTLAFPLSLGTWLVPALIGEFTRRHPRVRFVLPRTPVGEPGRASGALAGRAADVELSSHRIVGEGLRWERFAVEPLLLAVHPDHRVAGQTSAVLSDVADERFVMRRAPSGMRTQVLSLCSAAGISPHIAFEVDDQPTVRGFVAAGLGVAVVPAMGVPAPVTVGGVRHVPLRDPGASRELGLAWLDGRGRLPSAEAFRKFVLAHGAALGRMRD